MIISSNRIPNNHNQAGFQGMSAKEMQEMVLGGTRLARQGGQPITMENSLKAGKGSLENFLNKVKKISTINKEEVSKVLDTLG